MRAAGGVDRFPVRLAPQHVGDSLLHRQADRGPSRQDVLGNASGASGTPGRTCEVHFSQKRPSHRPGIAGVELTTTP